jgi:hypothetical protein
MWAPFSLNVLRTWSTASATTLSPAWAQDQHVWTRGYLVISWNRTESAHSSETANLSCNGTENTRVPPQARATPRYVFGECYVNTPPLTDLLDGTRFANMEQCPSPRGDTWRPGPKSQQPEWGWDVVVVWSAGQQWPRSSYLYQHGRILQKQQLKFNVDFLGHL